MAVNAAPNVHIRAEGQEGCSANHEADSLYSAVTRLNSRAPWTPRHDAYESDHLVQGQMIKFTAEIAQDGLPNSLKFHNHLAGSGDQHPARYRFAIQFKDGSFKKYWLNSASECTNTLTKVDFETANVEAIYVDIRNE